MSSNTAWTTAAGRSLGKQGSHSASTLRRYEGKCRCDQSQDEGSLKLGYRGEDNADARWLYCVT
jgi:hypothetical protein